jgi:hypothetical protein
LRGSSSTTSPRVGSSSTTSPTPHVWVPRHVVRLIARLVVDYFAYVAPPGASARRAARCRLLCLRRTSGCLGRSRGSSSTTCLVQARRRLLRLRRASWCLGTSRSSSSTTSLTLCVRLPRLVVDYFASRSVLSTTSPTPCVRVHRHVARLVARLVVDYFASCRLVVDYFAYAAPPDASAHHAAHHTARGPLLRLRRASGCLGTSRGSSSTTSPTPRVRVPRHVGRLVVDFFAYAARPGASARRASHRRLLRLRRTSGCLGTSRGSSSATLLTLCVWLPRLVGSYVTYVVRSGASARRAARRRLLRLHHVSGCLGTSHGSSPTTSLTLRIRVP